MNYSKTCNILFQSKIQYGYHMDVTMSHSQITELSMDVSGYVHFKLNLAWILTDYYHFISLQYPVYLQQWVKVTDSLNNE